MRITDRYQATIERMGRALPASTSKSASTSGPPQASGESSSILDIRVSPEAQQLSTRAAGVEQLKRQVQDGTFKVDPDAIAAKLVGGDE